MNLPLALLLLAPLVKGSVPLQPEAIKERTAHPGDGVLDEYDHQVMLNTAITGSTHAIDGGQSLL
jgi:hypothetical protein